MKEKILNVWSSELGDLLRGLTIEKMEIQAMRTTNSLICKTGRENAYRRAFKDGLGASRKELTFDRSLGVRGGHKCCGSKVDWRHKRTCEMATNNAPDDLSDLYMPGVPII